MWTGPVIVTAVVAGLGLVVAVASLGWQVRSAVRDRRTHVRVRVMRSVAWAGSKHDLLVIAAVNESSHPVRITKVEIELDRHGQAGLIGYFWGEFPGATIPGVVEARDTGITSSLLEAEADSDDVDLRACVHTADGLRFNSDWTKPSAIPWVTHLLEIPIDDSVRRARENPAVVDLGEGPKGEEPEPPEESP